MNRSPKKQPTKSFESKVTYVTFDSVAAYLARVIEVSTFWDLEKGGIFYRGVNDVTIGLSPGAIWKKVKNLEDSLVEDFLISSVPRGAPSLSDGWEIYALAQHFGLRTRLLDWSKSAMIALFFALEGAPSLGIKKYRNVKRDQILGNRSYSMARPAVWVLNPFVLNKIMFGRLEIFVARSSYDEPLQHGSKRGAYIGDFLPRSLRSDHRRAPPIPNKIAAIEPVLSNRRLQAQDGCFTVQGPRASFEAMSQRSLGKFLLRLEPDLAKTTVDSLRSELHTAGLREDDIYQDLGSLSRRINREWRFE